jgi:hypothetical protein
MGVGIWVVYVFGTWESAPRMILDSRKLYKLKCKHKKEMLFTKAEEQ